MKLEELGSQRHSRLDKKLEHELEDLELDEQEPKEVELEELEQEGLELGELDKLDELK